MQRVVISVTARKRDKRSIRHIYIQYIAPKLKYVAPKFVTPRNRDKRSIRHIYIQYAVFVTHTYNTTFYTTLLLDMTNIACLLLTQCFFYDVT